MSNRDSKHVVIPKTKECFEQALGTDAMFVTYASWAGILVDTNQDAAYIKFVIPWDFKKLVDLQLLMIPYAVLTSMGFYVAANWALPGSGDQTNQQNSWHAQANTVFHTLTECDITTCVNGFPLSPGQYLSLMISRQINNNINALILGAKLRYK